MKEKQLINYVFFDDNPEHRTFAKNVEKYFGKDSKITFVIGKNSQVDNKSFLSLRYDVVDFSDRSLKKLLEDLNSRFFFISKNADRNVYLAFSLMETAKKFDIQTKDISIYIAPNWDNIEAFILDKQRRMLRHFDVKLINIANLAAHTLSEKYKPVDHIEIDTETCGAKEDFRVAVLGLNHITREAMFKIYTQGRFENSKFILDVYDVGSEAKSLAFKSKYPGFVRDVDINFYDYGRFIDAIDAVKLNLSKYKLLIVDMGDDTQNSAFAKDVQEKIIEGNLTDLTVAPYISSPAGEFFDSDLYPSIIVFGRLESIYNPDAIILESYFRSGRYVNDYYNSTKKDAVKMRNWIGMSEFDKGSNISVADFNYTFVNLIGKGVFSKFKSSEEFKKWLHDNPKKFEALSRTEHLRWSAYLYSNGWDCMPLENQIMVENKNSKEKKHSCLVPFDELEKVSEMFNEDYKKYDADNVEIIYEIYKMLNS